MCLFHWNAHFDRIDIFAVWSKIFYGGSAVYQSNDRTLVDNLQPRRDLIKRERYLVPNSLVISRGCVNRCDFCYSNSFYRGGKHFYTKGGNFSWRKLCRDRKKFKTTVEKDAIVVARKTGPRYDGYLLRRHQKNYFFGILISSTYSFFSFSGKV